MAAVVEATRESTEQLSAALDALCRAEPQALADGETIVALHRQLERLAAVTTRASTPAAVSSGGSSVVNVHYS